MFGIFRKSAKKYKEPEPQPIQLQERTLADEMRALAKENFNKLAEEQLAAIRKEAEEGRTRYKMLTEDKDLIRCVRDHGFKVEPYNECSKGLWVVTW